MDTAVFDAAVIASDQFPFAIAVISIAVAWLAYAVLSRGLFLVTDPIRQGLLDLAEALCDEPTFPEEDKLLVSAALDQAYSTRTAWWMVGRSALLVAGLLTRTAKRPDKVEYPRVYARTYVDFQIRWTMAVLGNSAGATLLFATLLMVIAAFTLSASALARLLMGKNGGGHNGSAMAH
ncbi:hypothetical protein JP75_08130 [Devosia riboflavina]|uniref:Uncharacterized protein n=1 Tax=Devosia riboflavina TaxID=46914 RepID=A0A087M3P1_9HYPH|nr:hypothetical protein [Devosia riboflavina]KFL31494.1 hypothetical protein JP75_08130 [Devosia riboflavina]